MPVGHKKSQNRTFGTLDNRDRAVKMLGSP